MEGNSEALLSLVLADLEGFRDIIPNPYRFISRASNDQLFSDAGIEASNLSRVEVIDHVIKFDFIICAI